MLARPGADRARAAGWDWQLDSVGSPKAKPTSGDGDDDDTADVGDGPDHVDNGVVFTTEYLAHVCLFSPQYYDDNGYDGVAFALMDITIMAALWLL